MIKLYAMIFLLVNGVMGTEPEDTLTYNKRTFDTVEACEQYIKSEEFQPAKDGLSVVVANAYGPDARVVFECK
jgi:hypothetical protein